MATVVLIKAENDVGRGHGIKLSCGEMEMVLEIMNVPQASGKLGEAAQRTCLEVLRLVGSNIRATNPNHTEDTDAKGQ